MVLLYELTNHLASFSICISTLFFTEYQFFFKNPCFPLLSNVVDGVLDSLDLVGGRSGLQIFLFIEAVGW